MNKNYCNEVDGKMILFPCTEPKGHTDSRHVSRMPGLGLYVWGYVPEKGKDESK